MDVNSFYREVFEYTLGLDVLGLENRYRELVDLINDKTLVTFSNYIPCIYTTKLNLNDKNQLVREEYGRIGREYHVHDSTMTRFNLKVLDMLDVQFYNGADSDPENEYYYSSIAVSRQNIDLMSMLMGSESTYTRTLIDNSIPYKRYEEWRGNGVIFLQNYPTDGDVEVKFRVQYPNIVSIPEAYRETFISLALYDVKIKLYNELKFIEDVVTPAGNLNLKVSDWESAERDRTDFLRELRQKSFPDRVRDNYFILL